MCQRPLVHDAALWGGGNMQPQSWIDPILRICLVWVQRYRDGRAGRSHPRAAADTGLDRAEVRREAIEPFWKV
jgi:hypothetical protein